MAKKKDNEYRDCGGLKSVKPIPPMAKKTKKKVISNNKKKNR